MIDERPLKPAERLKLLRRQTGDALGVDGNRIGDLQSINPCPKRLR
jgi:hypothetical protein